MIKITDRVPSKPGRVKLTLDDGTVMYAAMERADDPIAAGDKVNKALLEGIQKESVRMARPSTFQKLMMGWMT